MLGLALAPVAVFAVFAALGAAGDFWEANVSYNRAYTAMASHRWVVRSALAPLWLMFGVAVVLGVARLVAARGRDVLTTTLLAWLIGALAGVELGGYDFPHYYAPCVPPAVALLSLPRRGASRAAAVVLVAFVMVVVVPFVRRTVGGFGADGPTLSARQFGPTLATLWNLQFDVGRKLQATARPGDRMCVAGAEPGFYWTSRIRPATRYPYDYPRTFRADWMPEYRREVCSAPPRFLVLPLAGLPEPCLDLSRYRMLLDVAVPPGSVQVLVRREP